MVGVRCGKRYAARVALRLGQEVDVVFPGLEEELDAHHSDIAQALDEGVRLHTAHEPLAVLEDAEGFACGVRCRLLEIKEGVGGLVLQPSSEPEQEIEAQTVILANGSKPNTFLSRTIPQLKSNADGTLWVDPATGQTSMEKVFAAGNIATGAGPVVDAIASGKAAAENIIRYLKDQA